MLNEKIIHEEILYLLSKGNRYNRGNSIELPFSFIKLISIDVLRFKVKEIFTVSCSIKLSCKYLYTAYLA